MRRVKTNESTPIAANADDRQATGKDQSLVIRYDYREQDFENWPRPSELELARLAAQLARTEKIDPKQWVAEAWEPYWESCRTIQTDHRKVEAYFAREAELERELNWPESETAAAVPMPKKFPVDHRQVEALLPPKQKGRTAERAALIREFIFFPTGPDVSGGATTACRGVLLGDGGGSAGAVAAEAEGGGRPAFRETSQDRL